MLLELYGAALSERTDQDMNKLYFTFDNHKYTATKGVYACAKPKETDVRGILRAVELLGSPVDPDELRNRAHVTLVYSKHQDLSDKNATPDQQPLWATVSGVEYWDGHNGAGYVVIKLESPVFNDLNRFFIENGAKHSFDDYCAHMTLCAKAGPRTPEVLEFVRNLAYMLRGLRLTFDKVCVEDLKDF